MNFNASNSVSMSQFKYFLSCLIKNPCNIGNITKCAGFLLAVATVNLLRVSIFQLHFCQKVSIELLDSSIASMISVSVMETAFGRPLSACVNFFMKQKMVKIVNSVNIGNYPTMRWSPLISPHQSRLSAVIVSSLWPPLLLYPSFSSFCPFDRQDPPRAF